VLLELENPTVVGADAFEDTIATETFASRSLQYLPST
jgi:hypothetical protein